MLAIGICACGSATGGLVYPAMFQQLIPTLGYGWTTRALALVVTVFLVVPNLLARPRLPPRSTGPIVELGAFKGLSYTLFAIGIFLVFWGVYFAFYYLSSWPTATRDPLNILLMITVASMICAWAMVDVTSREGLYAWAVIYGIVV
ncbi:hypothetical protein CTA1_6096 [Colletotrichum tanaceti]|uniref:Uncharacterized protein n=1 Tax=Colletotrichum tanaceti TaxID=1306861 RepID=A0A4U6XGU1_9PEZI|nr:hypothetical protein CTA1_6096 [Colletotrichum tanaceti]